MINTTTAGYQKDAATAGGRNGRLLVAWTDDSMTGADTSGTAFRAQAIDPGGIPRGGEFLANTTTGTVFGVSQAGVSFAFLAGGGSVLVWTDGSETGADPRGTAVRAQILTPGGLRSAVGGRASAQHHGHRRPDRTPGRGAGE